MRTGQGRAPGPPKGQAADAEASAQERVQAGITELLAAFKTLKVQASSHVYHMLRQPCSIDVFTILSIA